MYESKTHKWTIDDYRMAPVSMTEATMTVDTLIKTQYLLIASRIGWKFSSCVVDATWNSTALGAPTLTLTVEVIIDVAINLIS